MGLRDRLKQRIGSVLRGPDPPAPRPASVAPAPAPPTPAPEAPPPAVEPSPPAPAPAEPSPVAAASALPRLALDGDDAPLRNRHIPAPREATGLGFRVRVHNPDEGFDVTVQAEAGEMLLDAVERTGAVLPYSCRNGGCLSCTGKLISGSYEMGEQYTLEEDQIAAGFFLLCVSHATSDMEILSHQQDEVG